MKPFTCVECNEGMVRPMRGRGRTREMGMLRGFTLPEDIEIPTCDRCGQEYLDDRSEATVEKALRPLYEERLRTMAVEATDKIAAAGIRPWMLEQLLGLSQGYISRVRGGKVPSEALAVLFMMIAEAPHAKLDEIERLWGWPGYRGGLQKAWREEEERDAAAAGAVVEIATFGPKKKMKRVKTKGNSNKRSGKVPARAAR